MNINLLLLVYFYFIKISRWLTAVWKLLTEAATAEPLLGNRLSKRVKIRGYTLGGHIN